jgi:hypothetical protein
MPRKTNKVQLSFNSGEWSPLLDSRVDIEKAGTAARTMENMLAVVGGEARRRPGLRLVDEIPAPPEFVTLTNYIEVPLRQEHFQAQETTPGNSENRRTQFRGIVRLWQSGTVQWIGETRTTFTVDRDFRVATGETFDVLTAHVVGTAPAGLGSVSPFWGDWAAVNWSYRIPTGHHMFLAIETGPPALYDIHAATEEPTMAYPVGWLPFPFTLYSKGGAGSELTGNMSRSGNSIVTEGTLDGGGIFSASFGGVSYDYDTDTGETSGQTILFTASTAASIPYGPYSRTIPDSPTQGVIFELGAGAGVGAGISQSAAMFGPFFREAYSTPTIQQGVDPEA